ncbi:MAG: hypothetical protein GYB65_17955 [Chloroflexi bacterium]|nr:hypothetical protein [Chloroflexota bacterium]
MVDRGEWPQYDGDPVLDGPLGYVVVHQDWVMAHGTLDERRWNGEILAFFNDYNTRLCYITTEGDAVLYRAMTHPAGCPPLLPTQTAPGGYTLDLGQPGDEGFVGTGWFWAEPDFPGGSARWAGDYAPAAPKSEPRREALLYASLPPGQSYTVTIRAIAYYTPRTVNVTAANLVDGEVVAESLGSITVQPGDWAEYTLPNPIPAEQLAATGGDLAFSLAADGITPAGDRWLTLAYDWVQFRAVDP